MTGVTIELVPSPELLEALHDLTSAYRTMAAAIEARVPATAPEPEPPPVHSSLHLSWITPERDAVLREMVPTDAPWNDIVARVLALPGPRPSSKDAIKTRARKLQLVRPASALTQADRNRLAAMERARERKAAPAPEPEPEPSPAPTPPAPAPVATPAPPPQPPTRAAVMERVAAMRPGPGAGERREADFDQVSAWAAARGIQFESWEDLPRVNDRADRLGLAGFKRKLPGRSMHRPGGAA